MPDTTLKEFLWYDETGTLIDPTGDILQFDEATPAGPQFEIAAAESDTIEPTVTIVAKTSPIMAPAVAADMQTVSLMSSVELSATLAISTAETTDLATVAGTADLVTAAETPFMAKGWAAGEHYVLARDADGWSIAEPGQNHRVVYVSTKGRTNADGLTPDTPVNLKGLNALMKTLLIDPASPKAGSQEASWHVLFERGRDYGFFAPGYVNGEDSLHPFVIGAYGKGARPVFGNSMKFYEDGASNIVVRDVEFAYSPRTALVKDTDYRLRGIDILGKGHENLLFENVVVRPYNVDARIQSASENITLYRTMILDAHREDPAKGALNWKGAFDNRVSGLFATMADGLLIEESLFDHNGWEDGYRPSGARGPLQPPSMFSHNLYLNYSLTDVTLRDNIVSQAASVGAQLRSGGVIDGTLFFDNNAGLNMLGGGSDGAGNFLGQYGLLLDSVITAPSNKDAIQIGARGTGAQINGAGAVVDTIIAQDGDGLDSRPAGVRNPLRLDSGPDAVSVDGITIYNWGTDPNQTLPGAPSDAALSAVTLDRFAASVLGAGNDRFDLLAQWRSRDVASWDKYPGADDVIAFFRDGFGYAPSAAAAGRTVSFEPDARTEGFRWDNRLNWTDDRGPVADDTVRLDGHAVTYSGETLRIAGLDLGAGGVLRVTHGLLEVLGEGALATGTAGGAVRVANAGQFLFAGYGDPDRLTLSVAGGRAANTSTLDGQVDISVTGGQLLLAEGGGLFELAGGSRLEIRGGGAQVGFDDLSGTARFRLDGGTLAFVFDNDDVAPVTEFRSGRHGTAAPGVVSVFDVTTGIVVADLTALAPSPVDRRFTLVDADSLNGTPGAILFEFLGAAPGMNPELVWDTAAAALYLDIGGQLLF